MFITRKSNNLFKFALYFGVIFFTCSPAQSKEVNLVCNGSTKTDFFNFKKNLSNSKTESTTNQISVDFETKTIDGSFMDSLVDFSKNGSGFLKFSDSEVSGKGVGPYVAGSEKGTIDIEFSLNRFTGAMYRRVMLVGSEYSYTFISNLKCDVASRKF